MASTARECLFVARRWGLSNAPQSRDSARFPSTDRSRPRHATAALPQATTTAGAPSARARRWRRSRRPASSSGSGTRARPSSGSTPSLRRPRLLLSWLTTTTTTPTPWRRARRASPTSARARSARCARGGRRRLAPFRTSPRIPGRRPVSTRRLVVFPRRRFCDSSRAHTGALAALRRAGARSAGTLALDGPLRRPLFNFEAFSAAPASAALLCRAHPRDGFAAGGKA